MHFVVIMDPVSTVKVDFDTSFALMEESERRGHRVDHCLNTDLYLDRGRLYARVSRAKTQRVAELPLVLGSHEDVCLHDVDAVLVRTDPPFDDNYLWCTLMLDRLKGDTLVVNDPNGLRLANEKLYTTRFSELMPETMVSSHKERIKAFLERVGGHCVIKPLDGMGGLGVMVLKSGDPNVNVIIETTTRYGKAPAMVQVFMPEVHQGDKRILLLEGEPIAALLRIPQGTEVRSNMRVGGTALQTGIDDSDRRIIATVAPHLRRDGLMFVGIDIIGGRLTEVNVTSPTGLQAMNRLDGKNYGADVIDWLERKVSTYT